MNLMYSCKKAAELLLLSQDERLDLLQRTKLRMHLMACGNCQNFENQLNSIRELVDDRNLLDDVPESGARQDNN